MDSIDKNILLDLFSNCRTTFQEMATKNGVSANAIKKRFNKMLSTGAIENFYVELTLAGVDAEMLMAFVTTDGNEDANFIEMMGNNSMISYIGKLSGGVYTVFSCFQGMAGLSEMGTFFRNLPSVTNVELHPLLIQQGNKVEFSNLQIKVLKCLIENPRETASEIAKKTGLTSRMVSKTINELMDEGGVNFGINWNPNISGIVVMIRVQWDEHGTNLTDVLSFLQNTFPDEYFTPMISASNPLLFATFIVKDLKVVQNITTEIKNYPHLTNVITYMGEPSRVFPDIKTIKLNEIVNSAAK
ncbi:MAG: winged helix-turn-helix transcriptional regulator [Candidatus Hodarchaeales archaeon]|jgi:DNA-binding Lrp family transcriptional regulator